MLAKKIRTIDTEQAAEAMSEYLQPIARSMCDAMRVSVELDDVINLIYPDIDKWNWNINSVLLSKMVSVVFFPAICRVDITEHGVGDLTSFTILMRGCMA